MARGFILQSTYRTEDQRAVILLHGTLESGESFLVRETRQVPLFHVRAADAERARELGIAPSSPGRVQRLSLRGEPVLPVEVARPHDVPPLRDRLSEAGIPTFEADLRFAYRYLIDRGIRGSVHIEGASRPGQGVDQIFENPELSPADWTPDLSVLAFDIETDPQARRLLSVSLVGCGAQEVLLLTPPGYSCPPGALPFPDEPSLLRAFCKRVVDLDPDVLTGWNVIDFDLTVLQALTERFGISLALGRGPEPLHLRQLGFRRGGTQARLPGRLVLDGIQLLRDSFIRLESYSLQNAAMEILNRGKTKHGPGRAEEILEAFETDREGLVEYNLTDSLLVQEILSRLGLVDLAVQRSRLTGMPPDRVGASIASFDFVYLTELHRRGIVAPTVDTSATIDEEIPLSGGHVLESRPGLYRNILVFDFKSLYPSVIRTFQIDPLGYLPEPGPEGDPIVAPNGAAFDREPGILPQILDELFERREAAKRDGDRVASQAIKILMNSFYGVLGTSACRFANPALANAITGFGREILLWSQQRFEARGHRVLYGDTDSLFVDPGEEDPERARALAERLVASLNRDLTAWVAERWRVSSRLELEFEKLFLRLLLPHVRHGTAGARKRYAGLVAVGDETRVVFTGMEVVRRDWTDLARRVQRELYERLFHDQPVDAYLRQVVADLREGRLDDLLIYRKALRKDTRDYTAATPPHVVAARKLGARAGRIISYVITREGPEPALERCANIDHEHYLERQVRPVAEPVLELLGLRFDRVIGDDAQLDLFR